MNLKSNLHRKIFKTLLFLLLVEKRTGKWSYSNWMWIKRTTVKIILHYVRSQYFVNICLHILQNEWKKRFSMFYLLIYRFEGQASFNTTVKTWCIMPVGKYWKVYFYFLSCLWVLPFASPDLLSFWIKLSTVTCGDRWQQEMRRKGQNKHFRPQR